VTTPFDYMKAMAELWARGGKDFAAAQQTFYADLARAAGGELPSNGTSAALFDPQGLTQANEAFGRLWSSALELSQTIGRNIQGNEKSNPIVGQLLGKIFDPRAWFSGPDGMDQTLQKMAEGPQLADMWNTERKMLVLFNAWSTLRRRSLEHNAVMLEAWIAAAGTFAKDLNAKADAKESVGSWRDVLALWVETANIALLETQRSETYLKSQREILKASTDLRLAQQDLAKFYSEMFGYPTREELDEVHRTVTELRRELRALQRRSRDGRKRTPTNSDASSAAAQGAEPNVKTLAHSWEQYESDRSKW
jgi:class III poly(R)-hydroxyalkanoic acid synthase PhaE subunit